MPKTRTESSYVFEKGAGKKIVLRCMFIAELLIKCLKVNKVRLGERVLETYFIAFKSDQLENVIIIIYSFKIYSWTTRPNMWHLQLPTI